MKLTNKRGTFTLDVSDDEFQAELARCQSAAYRGERETPEQCARGRLLSQAMHMQGLRDEAEAWVPPTDERVLDRATEIARETEIFTALEEFCRYNVSETWMRGTGGHRMSEGMRTDWSRAVARAAVLRPEQIEAAIPAARRDLNLRRDYIGLRTGV